MNALAARDSTTNPMTGSLPFVENPEYLGIEWDAENRLLAVKQGTTTLASFTYDGKGKRVQKIAAGLTTTYVHDRGQIIEERKSTGGTIRHFSGPGIDHHVASLDSNGNASYFVGDHVGSVTDVTNVGGTVVLHREYDPWGNPTSSPTSSGYAFTGREWDDETDLYYYRARYYDSGTGRFLSEDPAGIEFDFQPIPIRTKRAHQVQRPMGASGSGCLPAGSPGMLMLRREERLQDMLEQPS